MGLATPSNAVVEGILRKLTVTRTESLDNINENLTGDDREMLNKLIAETMNRLELLYIILNLPAEPESTGFLSFKE